MNIIIPAILPKSQSELEEKVSSILNVAQLVQVDVCDGVFVPSKTEFSELPHKDQIEYELDLMIDQPEDHLEKYIAMNPKSMIVHIESVRDQAKLRAVGAGFTGEMGVSISNDTPIEQLQFWVPPCEFMPKLFIQLMGIAKIGFQGEAFDDRVLERINYCREKFPDREIAVDGGVSLETIAKLRDIGVTRFVCGSAVFGGDPQENIEKLQKALSL